MRPKKPETTRSGDLFRARLDLIWGAIRQADRLSGRRLLLKLDIRKLPAPPMPGIRTSSLL